MENDLTGEGSPDQLEQPKAEEEPGRSIASDFDPDAYIADKQKQNVSIPAEFNPDAYILEKQKQQFGSDDQSHLAALENIARSATLGLSDVLETKTGFQTPEQVLGRRQVYNSEHPWMSLGAGIAGAAIPLALTGGLAAPLTGAGVAAGLGSTAASIAALATEGATFGAGNALSDYALGDPSLNASKIASHIGLGALFGAGIGAISKTIESLPSIFRAASDVPPGGGGPSGSVFGVGGVLDPVLPATKKSGVVPTSFEELQQKISEAVSNGASTELPAAHILDDAASRVQMDIPVTPMQRASLGSQSERDAYKTMLEMPGEKEDILRAVESVQKQDLTNQIKETVSNLAPQEGVTDNAIEAGNRASEAFTNVYQNQRKALSPIFERFKNIPLAESADHIIEGFPEVLQKMTDALPSLSRMFDLDPDSGLLKLLPYKTSWGVDPKTYTAVKDVVNALKEKPETFEELVNIRRGLWPPDSSETAPPQIKLLKSSLMDYMGEQVDKHIPESDLRDVFAKWAQNEKQGQVIENIFGASIGSPKFQAISKVKPENILDNIFRNSATVNAAKDILPQDQFKSMLGNYLNLAIKDATNLGSFSSNKFATFLKRNEDAISAAVKDSPEISQRLHDLTTVSRILPDSPSINPSGTAKTIVNSLKQGLKHDTIQGATFGILNELKDYAAFQMARGKQIKDMSAQLAGKSDQAKKLMGIQKIINKTNENIDSKIGKLLKLTGRAATGPADRNVNK